MLTGAVDGHVHLFVADVIKSFDTVDRGVLDCALGRLVLPEWFRRVYFSFHAKVRLRFKLAAGLGKAWTRDGGIPHCCLLSMVFIVALYVPWCGHLGNQHAVTPQLNSDNLKCTTSSGPALLAAARFTDQKILSVGQEASPSKCAQFCTSKDTRKNMKDWAFSAGNKSWGTKLDVRDLGGHLDVTCRAGAGNLSRRTVLATSQVRIVRALPFGFLRLIGIIGSKYLPPGLHGAEGAHVYCKKKLPMAKPQSVLNLLDAPDCCDLVCM